MSAPRRIAILSSAGGGGAGIAARRLADVLNATGRHVAHFIDIDTLGEAVPQSVSPQASLTNHGLSDTHFTLERHARLAGRHAGRL